MDIVVVFEKITLNSIKGNAELFSKRIGEAGRILASNSSDEHINVKLLEGLIANSSIDTKATIILSFNRVVNNIGRQMLDFKTEVIKIFAEYGINIDVKSLLVKVNPPYDINKFIEKMHENTLNNRNTISPKSSSSLSENNEFDYEQKSKQYTPVEPLYSFDRVIIPNNVRKKIEEAIGILQCENKVFKEWGLYEIQPHPSTSLSFYGPSGTGKTMAAEAVAQKLGKKILKVSYADVESKYHGEGPKMVKAIFLAATNEDAVLFFDEADSLLSKRLTNVSQGSEQAINSMRSQLLICLEEFRGIVIFATNLVINYDQAFLTRLISVEFTDPDRDTRKKIWNVHIRPAEDGQKHQLNIPLSDDVNTDELADKYEFVGREIRNAVVSACVSTVLSGRSIVEQSDFIKSCDKILAEKNGLAKAKDHTKQKRDINDVLKEAINNKIKEKEEGEHKDVSKSTE